MDTNEGRRSTDAQMAVMFSKVSAMESAISRMADAVAKIAVLDERMLGHGQTTAKLAQDFHDYVQRQDDAKEEHERREQTRDEANWKEHAAFRRYMNFTTGAAVVVQAIAGICLMYAFSTISSLVSDSHQVDLQIQGLKQNIAQHIKEDQLQSEEDLRRALSQLKQGATIP